MSAGFTDIPDLGQNDGPAAVDTLEWVDDVITAALTDGIMPPPPIPIDPGVFAKLMAWLTATFEGLGPILPEGPAPDLGERPA